MECSRRRRPETEAIQQAKRRALDTVEFRGHPAVLSLHPTTIEVTTEDWLTSSGDCILGVSATKGCSGLSEEVKAAIRTPGSRITATIRVGSMRFAVSGEGDPRLGLSSDKDMVIRKSRFLSERTVLVGASAAARDVPRQMVEMLKDPAASGVLELEAWA